MHAFLLYAYNCIYCLANIRYILKRLRQTEVPDTGPITCHSSQPLVPGRHSQCQMMLFKPTTLNSLPDEILASIFSFNREAKQMYNFARVCHRWHQIIRSDRPWLLSLRRFDVYLHHKLLSIPNHRNFSDEPEDDDESGFDAFKRRERVQQIQSKQSRIAAMDRERRDFDDIVRYDLQQCRKFYIRDFLPLLGTLGVIVSLVLIQVHEIDITHASLTSPPPFCAPLQPISPLPPCLPTGSSGGSRAPVALVADPASLHARLPVLARVAVLLVGTRALPLIHCSRDDIIAPSVSSSLHLSGKSFNPILAEMTVLRPLIPPFTIVRFFDNTPWRLLQKAHVSC